MKMLKDSKAVSPVIGVMLMLVVTVILAAAVSSTSSGLIKSSDKAPTAVFDIKIKQGVSQSGMPGVTADSLSIKEVTGDSIPTSDLKIVTINPNAAGDVKTIETTAGVINHFQDWMTEGSVAPWRNNGSYTPASFGDYTLKPGVTMLSDSWSNYDNPTWDDTTGSYGTVTPGTTEIDALHSMFADYESLSEGDWVTVKIIHIPTQKVIYQSDVEVE